MSTTQPQTSTNDPIRVPVSDFGKDHWSLLAYLETCCVDNRGRFDRRRVRCNEHRHPLMANTFSTWKPSYGTQLAKPEQGDTVEAPCLKDHDDYDCLDDLENAGLIEIISVVNAYVRMTPLGMQVSALLRQHKMNGRNFASFRWSPPGLTCHL